MRNVWSALRSSCSEVGLLPFVVGCSVVAGVTFGASFMVTRHVAAQSRVGVPAVRPFTAMLSKKYFDSAGRLAIESEIEYGRTAHRTTVVRQRRISPGPPENEMSSHITDFDKEVEILLDPLTKSATTLSSPQAQQLSFIRGSWDETCPKASDSGTVIADEGSVLLGYHVLHVTARFTKEWTVERWMAPELECFSLKEINSRGGAHNEALVTTLIEGPPPIELLQVPTGYVERGPLETEELHKSVTGSEAWGPSFAKKLDLEYQKRKLR